MNLKKYIKNNFAELLILAIFVFQIPIWPLWYIPYMPLSFLFCILFFLKKGSLKTDQTRRKMLAVILLGLAFVIMPYLNGGGHGSNFLYFLCFIGAISITYKEANTTVEMLSKGLGIIVVITLIPWIYHQAISPLPSLGSIDLTAMKGNYTVMENYGFFVINPTANVFRFYSVFDEPGALGTLGAYLLYANKYQFSKWYNLSILLGCLCTLSAAFYILTLMGMLYLSIGSMRRLLMIVIPLLIIFWIGYEFIKDSEEFNGFVVERILNASDSLDERSGDAVGAFFKRMSLFELLFGIGYSRVVELGLDYGASYKNFIIENGLVSLLILIYSYWNLHKKTNRDVLVFTAMFWLSFLQRPTSFTGWQMLIYACIVTRLAYCQEINKSKMIPSPFKQEMT